MKLAAKSMALTFPVMTKRIVLLQALASTPADVERLVRPLDETAADWKPAIEDWSARDVLSHLIHVERAFLIRLNRVIHEHEPVVPYIHPEESTHDRQTPVKGLSGQFQQARNDTLATLQQLGPGDWQRVAIHETKGRMTLRYLVQDMVEHDIEHSNQLVEILQSWRSAERQVTATRLG